MANVPGLALYHFVGCGYCARVRAAMQGLNVEIELRDTLENPDFSADVRAATGRSTVPVLRIEGEDGDVRWLPESLDIIRYLQERFQ
ncbi:MAG: glutaredoxin [Deltaproteobacteria bacterium]|nr:glutaredoxin [Deltaproteobacteria bacterium]